MPSIFERLIWNAKMRSLTLALMRFLPVDRNTVFCICWGGKKYNCNPKAITDAILKREGLSELRIVYAFEHPEDFTDVLPSRVEAVQVGTLQYFKLLSTAHFIIANTRFTGILWPFEKKKEQIYIQTQHGGHGIKKVELDVRDSLTDEYISNAIEDTKRTDLMLSDSKYWTNVYRTAYQYKGEVLEYGLPRNDIFFANDNEKEKLKQNLLQFINIHSTEKYSNALAYSKFLIYTPTFRNNDRRYVYGFDANRVVEALETRFGGTWYILVSSHPNMLEYYKEIYDFSHPRLIDVGGYPELQDILVVADALITDYSSAEMDFSLTKRPQFQLIRDREDYDRGTYLDPSSLPFPYSENDEDLCANILNFDNEKYQNELKAFNEDVVGLNESGYAAEHVADWMRSYLQ